MDDGDALEALQEAGSTKVTVSDEDELDPSGFKSFGKLGSGHFIFQNFLIQDSFIFMGLKLVFEKVIVVWVKYFCCFLKREKKKKITKKEKMKSEKEKNEKRKN